MTGQKEKNFENSEDNTKIFLENQSKRIAPNNRIGEYHFFDIANKGAKLLKNAMIKK